MAGPVTGPGAAAAVRARWSSDPLPLPQQDHLRITARVADLIVAARTWPSADGRFTLTVTRLVDEVVTGHGQVVGDLGDWVGQVCGVVPPSWAASDTDPEAPGAEREDTCAPVPLSDALVLLEREAGAADDAVRAHLLADLRMTQVPSWLQAAATARASVCVEAVRMAAVAAPDDGSRVLLVAVCGPRGWWRLGHLEGQDTLVAWACHEADLRERLVSFCTALLIGRRG